MKSPERSIAESAGSGPPLAAGQLQALDLFLEAVSRSAVDCATREPFYSLLVSKLPTLIGASHGGILIPIAGNWVPAFQSPSSEGAGHQGHWDLAAISHELSSLSDASLPPSRPVGIETAYGWVLLAPCRPEGQSAICVALVFREQPNGGQRQAFLDLIGEIAAMVVQFEERLYVRAQRDRLGEIQQLNHLLLDITRARNLRQMAFSLVNDLARFSRADRVVCFQGDGRIMACSGVTAVSEKSKVLQRLGNLARSAFRRGISVTHFPNGPETGNAMIDGLREAVLQVSEAQAMMVMPIQHDGHRVAVLSFEYLGTAEADWVDLSRRIEAAVELISPVVVRTKAMHSIPFLPTAAWLSERVLRRPLRGGFLLLGFAALGWGAYWWATHSVAPFEITARGTLAPQTIRQVFAPLAGTVDEVFVQEGLEVEAERPLLRMHSPELQAKATQLRGELEEANQQLSLLRLSEYATSGVGASTEAELNRARIASEIKRQTIRIETLTESLELVRGQEAELEIVSPLAGTITTRKIESTLRNRPVNLGDPLLTIADTDAEWELLLDVDELKIGYVADGIRDRELHPEEGELEVRFRLVASPTQEFRGTVRDIEYAANRQTGNVAGAKIRVRVDVDENQLGGLLRLGTGVDARILCGERSYWFLLSYELRDQIRKWFFF